MFRRAALVFACLAAACGSAGSDDAALDDASGEDALIGGAPATLAQFPATLYLKKGCTAAKVAEKKLLTAAHCVIDGSTLDAKYGPGKPVELTREPAKGFTTHAVAKLHVHPAWVPACESAYCASSSVTATLDAADVAVIELAEDLQGVPSAPIDTAPLATREKVTVLGFGCTEGVLAQDARPEVTLKFAETTILAASRAVHEGSPVEPTQLGQVSGIYAMTPGPARVKGAGGLCPGDSGGPLYKKRGDALVVVGVNANYTLRPGEKDLAGIPVTNWHTRLDDRSRLGVATWLASIGAARAPTTTK
ncbi:MAG: trypsin-like serine protease [Deltaproteobacteria bacterium]|nr:trypsin-like serine protease [Deltaproteobacteria bacterium]